MIIYPPDDPQHVDPPRPRSPVELGDAPLAPADTRADAPTPPVVSPVSPPPVVHLDSSKPTIEPSGNAEHDVSTRGPVDKQMQQHTQDSKPEIKTGGNLPAQAGPLKVVPLWPGKSPMALDMAEEALLEHAERLRIFQRSGEVVRVVALEKDLCTFGLTRKAGSLIIVPVKAPTMAESFERIVVWQKPLSGAKDKPQEYSRIDCPARIANAYLARVGDWRLPTLRGIISAPLMRPDGTILCTGEIAIKAC